MYTSRFTETVLVVYFSYTNLLDSFFSHSFSRSFSFQPQEPMKYKFERPNHKVANQWLDFNHNWAASTNNQG